MYCGLEVFDGNHVGVLHMKPVHDEMEGFSVRLMGRYDLSVLYTVGSRKAEAGSKRLENGSSTAT